MCVGIWIWKDSIRFLPIPNPIKLSLYSTTATPYRNTQGNVFMQPRAEAKLVWTMPRQEKGQMKSNNE